MANRRDEGWTGGNHLKIYDLSDPAKPVYIRDFGLLGSQPDATAYIGVKKGIGIHGPISAGPAKNRVYIAYGTGNEGVIQIVDRQKLLTAFKNPLKPTDAEMLAPQVGVITIEPVLLVGRTPRVRPFLIPHSCVTLIEERARLIVGR